MGGHSRGRAMMVASLSLNLFLVAAFVAMIVWGAHRTNRQGSPTPLRLAAHSLDVGHRQVFLAMLRANGRAVGPANREARALRIQAFSSLQNPNFDPTSAKAMLARARDLNQAATARVQDSVVDFAASLPLDQRASLGRALAARMPHPPAPRETASAAGASGS